MADVYVNALTTISTEPTSTDSVVCVNRNTNEGQIIDYSLLADKILNKLTSKTFSTLTTTSKLLTGGINELDSDITAISSNLMHNAVSIASQCSISSGTIDRIDYLPIGNLTAIWVQVNGITFSGSNIWLQLPDSFPAAPGFFSPLATAYAGMTCVFRSQNGSGKYLLIQSTTNATLNLTAAGVCLNA